MLTFETLLKLEVWKFNTLSTGFGNKVISLLVFSKFSFESTAFPLIPTSPEDA
jgi:hypothetical protein